MNKRAFTLVETIVVVALTAFVLMVISGLIVYFYRTNAYVLEETKALESARRSVSSAIVNLRGASYGADGSYPVATAATSSITFYTSVGTAPTVNKVRYYLSGTTLYRGVTTPAGNPPSYTGQTEATTLVIDNIRNGTSTAMFTYFDSTGTQLASPVNIGQIASIRITVMTDVNPNRAPDVYTLTGSATLRNL